jgi:hypothetical protein
MFLSPIAPLIHISIISGLFLNVTTSFTTSTIADICSLLGNVSYVYRELPCPWRSHPEYDGWAAGSYSLYFFAPSLWS